VILIFGCLPRSKKNLLSVSVMIIAVFSSLALAGRANGFVQSVNVIVFLSSFFLLLLLLAVDRVHWALSWLIRYVFVGFFACLTHIFRLFEHSKTHNNSQFNFTTLLRTSLITVVMLGFFIGLLSQADPIFAKLVKDVWDQAIGRAISSVVIAILFTVMATLRLKTAHDQEEKFSLLSYQDLFVPGVAVAIIFGIFLFIQAKYLFGSQLDLPSFGLTYSAYVRKGFMELLIATFFGGILTYCIALLGRQEESKPKKLQLKILNVVLLIQLGFLLASAWKRNGMYMDVYGITRVRLVGEVLLLWLAGFLVALLLFSVWKKWSEARLFASILVLSTLVLIALNVQNIDQTIVQYSPSHHNFRDYFYLSIISEDGKASWPATIAAAEQLLNTAQSKTEFTPIDKAQLANMKLALIALKEKREKLERKYLAYDKLHAQDPTTYPEQIPQWLTADRKWQSWNMAQAEGFQVMEASPTLYHDKLDQLSAQFIKLQKLKNLDLSEQESRLLYELQYPFVSVQLNYRPTTPEELKNSLQPVQDEIMPPSPTPLPSSVDLPY